MNPNETLASGNSCRYLLFVFVIMVFCPCFGQGQTAQEAADERLQEINQDDFAGDRVAELAQLLEVYEQLPFDKNRVATMSRLAYELNDGSRPMSDSLALAAIELAKTSLGDSHAAATYYAYRALAQYHSLHLQIIIKVTFTSTRRSSSEQWTATTYRVYNVLMIN